MLYRTNKSLYFINFIYGRVCLLIPNSSFILKLCLWHSFYPLEISGFLNFLSQGIYCFFAGFLGLFSWVFWIRFLFSRSTVFSCLRPHGLQHARLPCPSPSPRGLLKLTSVAAVMPSNHLSLCCLLLFLPSTFPSITVFSNRL